MAKIEDMREALKAQPPKGELEVIEEILPDMMVVDVDDPEQYVEKKALSVAGEFSAMASDEAQTIEEYGRRLSWVLELLADEDAAQIKKVMAGEREHQLIFTQLAAKYDEAGVGGDAQKAIAELLRQSKKGN